MRWNHSGWQKNPETQPACRQIFFCALQSISVGAHHPWREWRRDSISSFLRCAAPDKKRHTVETISQIAGSGRWGARLFTISTSNGFQNTIPQTQTCPQNPDSRFPGFLHMFRMVVAQTAQQFLRPHRMFTRIEFNVPFQVINELPTRDTCPVQGFYHGLKHFGNKFFPPVKQGGCQHVRFAAFNHLKSARHKTTDHVGDFRTLQTLVDG